MFTFRQNNKGKYLIILAIFVVMIIIGVLGLIKFFPKEEEEVTVADFDNPIFEVNIPSNYTKPLIIKAFNQILSIQPIQARSVAQIKEKDNIIKYIDAYQNTDVVQTQSANKLKEDIILKAPGHPNEFEYEINMEDYDMEKDGVGNLFFYPRVQEEKDHKITFKIPAPFLIDNQGRESSTGDVEVFLNDNLLTIFPSPDWLNNHPYPITLDPSFEIEDEILAKRTISSKTYDLGDNKFRTIGFLEQIHYQDEQGKWQEIISDIENGSDEAGFDWQNINNNYKTYFKNNSLGEYLKFQVNNAWVKYKLENNPDLEAVNNTEAVIDKNVLVYSNVYKGIDLRYTVLPNKLLEEYIVAATSTARQINELEQEFIFQGVSYEEQPDGSIDFKNNQDGKVLWKLPKPVMYELANKSISNYGLHYEIKQVGQRYFIKKVLEPAGKAWLIDPIRTYPVVIDASAGPRSPGTITTDNGSEGTVDWITPDNAKIEDDTNAYTEIGSVYAFCLAPNTLIATQNGDRAIQDLKSGDLVYSYNHDLNKIELKEISNVVHRPIINYGSKYYHIYFGSSSLRATYNHLVYANNEWVMAKDLKLGDELLDINGNSQLINKIVIEENDIDEVWDLSVNDNKNFFAGGVLVHNAGIYDHRVRIIKGGAVGVTDKADGTAWGNYAYTTYGGSADLWGEEDWTADNINASVFGIAISAVASGYDSNSTSYYLKATNFGFTIPADSTINGITVEIRKTWSSRPTGPVTIYQGLVDHIRITVEYTEGGGGEESAPPGMTIEGGVLEIEGGVMTIE